MISDDSDSEETLLGRQPLFSDDSTALDAPELTKEQAKVVQSIFPQGDDHSDDLKRAFRFSPEFSQNYRIGRLLGSGSSGFVVSARRLEDGRDVRDQSENASLECASSVRGGMCNNQH